MKFGNLRVNRAGTVMAVMLAALLLVGASVGKGGKKTHFGVPPSMIVNIMTESVPNNNAGGALFYYDRNPSSGPFTVPEDYAFVVTDIFIEPANLDPANDYLVVIGLDGGESRFMNLWALEPEARHVAFGGAMIMSSGTPTARNTSSSTTACDIRILGYFVKGEGLDGGESLFPEP